MFTADDKDGNSYFLKHDLLTGVVACPGIAFPSLQKSCYVSIDDILDLDEDDDEIVLNNQKNNTILTKKQFVQEQNGPVLVRKKYTKFGNR